MARAGEGAGLSALLWLLALQPLWWQNHGHDVVAISSSFTAASSTSWLLSISSSPSFPMPLQLWADLQQMCDWKWGITVLHGLFFSCINPPSYAAVMQEEQPLPYAELKLIRFWNIICRSKISADKWKAVLCTAVTFSKQEAQICSIITSFYEANKLYFITFSGVYFFTFNMMKHEDVEEVYVYLMHNGNTVFSLYR